MTDVWNIELSNVAIVFMGFLGRLPVFAGSGDWTGEVLEMHPAYSNT